MTENHSIFFLPNPLPHDSILVGPWDIDLADAGLEEVGGPISGAVDTGPVVLPPVWRDPAEALTRLQRQLDATSADDRAGLDGRLILLHQDGFAGPEGADALVDWLEELAELRAPYLPVLVHGNLDGQLLVRFFRAGLFDALSVPLAQPAWVNMLIRAAKRLERRHQSRLILASGAQTRQVLRHLHGQLGEEARAGVGELMGAKESLEAANRELSDAMAELSLLYRFGRELSAAGNWDRVLREILEELCGFIGAGGAALILRSANEGSFRPRQTWQWEESAWDKVLVSLHDQVDDAVAESIMAPGVFSVDPGADSDSGPEQGRRLLALPLEYQETRLGYLLLLFVTPAEREAASARYLPFLQAVQVVLSEEVASAQMLDRIRDISAFNSRVLETVRSSIWVLDENGRTVYCNRSGQAMLTGEASPLAAPEEFQFQIGRGRLRDTIGARAPEMPELVLDARLRLDDVPGLVLPVLRAAEDGSFRGEGIIARDDGLGIPVLIQSAQMLGRARKKNWLVVVAEDLRDSRQLEAERLKSDRLEGLVEMSATLAHEIRNPLMGLSAQAELLAEQLGENDPKARYIEVITGEVERINETITRMLNYVRPYQPRRNETAFGPLGRDVMDLVKPRAEERSVCLELNLPDGAGAAADLMLWVDGNQIKQVLLNLLINAIDAAPDGGRVGLTIAPSTARDWRGVADGRRFNGAGLTLTVIDNGPGFSADQAAKLFRPFYTTKSSGTGLGLSICHKIVVAHNGDIVADRIENNTVFRVLLPDGSASAPSPDQAKEDAE